MNDDDPDQKFAHGCVLAVALGALIYSLVILAVGALWGMSWSS